MDIFLTLSSFSEYSDEPMNMLEQSGYSYAINYSGKRMTPEEVLLKAPNAKVLVAGVEPYEHDTLEQLKELQAISRVGVGTDAINKKAAKKFNVAILNTPDEPTLSVAELTITMILSLLKRLPQVDQDTHNRLWKRTTGNLLSGKKVGIIGYGRIGRKVAELLNVFGVDVLVYDPFLKELDDKSISLMENIDELLKNSDVVTLHASSSEGYIMDKAKIALMKKGAWLVNLARGGMVDECALLEALSENKLSGAALDVYNEEPYKSELCDCDKIIMTPHQSTLTFETRTAMELKAVSNAIDFLDQNKK